MSSKTCSKCEKIANRGTAQAVPADISAVKELLGLEARLERDVHLELFEHVFVHVREDDGRVRLAVRELFELLHGDLGTTLTDNQKVSTILTHYGAATFELAFLALIVALIVGIGLGRIAARKRDHAADAGIRTFAILCYATPVFFLGLILKLIFAIWLNVLPASGRSSLGSEMQFSRLVSPTGFYIIDAIQLGDMSVLLDVLRHAVLPALALGLLTAGVFIRLVRTNVIATYNSGYVEAARSRGVSEKRLLNKHAWKPALIPIITVMGMQIALMLAGAVLTETTFEWKGLGFMLSQYLKARDFVAVQGIVILIAIIVAVVNFIVDVIAALVDPRVRY